MYIPFREEESIGSESVGISLNPLRNVNLFRWQDHLFEDMDQFPIPKH